MKDATQSPDRLWTIQELATWLGKSKKTIYNWRAVGYGPPPIKIGSELRWRRSGVEHWLDAQTEGKAA